MRLAAALKSFLSRTFLIITAVLLSSNIQAEEIVLKGAYQGKNLYVLNPSYGSDKYCATQVIINGKTLTDEINSSSFEIDFSSMGINIGDEIVVKIMYEEGCVPQVINPEVIKPSSTFKIISMRVDAKNELLLWTTSDETSKLPYIIEQFKWNRWVKVGEAQGVGAPGEHQYSVGIMLNSGRNKFRVKQVDYSGVPRYSNPLPYNSRQLPLSINENKIKNSIKFSSATNYEIYDEKGNLLLSGFNDVVDIESLKKGKYFTNFDNTSQQLEKK